MKCGKCWSNGHVGNRCKSKVLNPTAMPYWSNRAKQQTPTPDVKSFDDLLQKPCPLAGPTMPASRPKTLSYHADANVEMMEELTRLSRGVVFDTHGFEMNFSLKDVASFAVRTGEVTKAEISVGMLSKTRFLLILPEGMAPETFIQSTTPELWDSGFTFQPWSPMDEGKMVLPEYKVLLELTGLPPHFRKPNLIAKAMGVFGTYLGSVPNSDPANLAAWKVAVAVDRLESVPEQLSITVRAMEYPIKIHVANWLRAPLYTAADLPKLPEKFSKPPKPAWNHPINSPAPFVVSKAVLLEICKGRDFAELPEEIQHLLATIPEAAHFLSNHGGGGSSNPKSGTTEKDDLSYGSQEYVAGQTQESQAGHAFIPHQPEPQIIKPPGSKGRRPGKEPANPPSSPQKITENVQILKRPDAQRTPANVSLIPGQISRREPSAQKSQTTRTRVQQMGNQRIEASRPRQQVTRVNTAQRSSNSGPKPKVGFSTRPTEKTNAGLTCLKLATFKKALHLRTNQRKVQQPTPLRKAVVSQTQEGFFQVDVQYSHLAALSSGCGLPIEVINKALHEDNLQRASSPTPDLRDENMEPDTEGPDVSFDPELSDGLDSEADEDL